LGQKNKEDVAAKKHLQSGFAWEAWEQGGKGKD
jgi:hypothetical protein